MGHNPTLAENVNADQHSYGGRVAWYLSDCIHQSNAVIVSAAVNIGETFMANYTV